MRRSFLAVLLVVALLGSTVVVSAAPPRPLPVTAGQFQELQRLEAQPHNAAMQNVHASYKSERERSMDFTRASDDFWTVAYTGGFPATILAVIICAAPL